MLFRRNVISWSIHNHCRELLTVSEQNTGGRDRPGTRFALLIHIMQDIRVFPYCSFGRAVLMVRNEFAERVVVDVGLRPARNDLVSHFAENSLPLNPGEVKFVDVTEPLAALFNPDIRVPQKKSIVVWLEVTSQPARQPIESLYQVSYENWLLIDFREGALADANGRPS